MCTHFSIKNPMRLRRFYLAAGLVLLALGLVLPAAAQAAPKTVTANVAILDHVLVFNRLGAQNLNAMIFALERDLVDATTLAPCGSGCTPGNTMLRPDKRPRPLVLRVSAGDTLVVNFKNLLTSNSNPGPPFDAVNGPANPALGLINEPNNQVADRHASFYVQGLQLTPGSNNPVYVGNGSATGVPGSGGSAIYTYEAEEEGAFLVTSMGATFGGEATGGNVGVGAFGAVMVEPPGARYYRSQVTEEELRLAAMDLEPSSDNCGQVNTTPDGHPIIDYEALYPAANCDSIASSGTGVDLGATVWVAEGKAGKPILNMLDAGDNLVHSDINAIIAYGNASGILNDGIFPTSAYPNIPPNLPNRREPFREFASIWSDESAVAQAFNAYFADAVLGHTLHGVRDSFMINYGSGGIGSEIIANRLGVGPMWDCLDCAYEEFFLTSFTVGDPAMLVDVPANTGIENVLAPAADDLGPKATRAFYPDDPANVHHSYTGDFVKFRNVHAGPKEQHIFHLHNHQWLFNPNDDNSNYIDAQGIGPGSGYTYEIVNGGGGNRNKTAGDAIFHCHFYPHFAQGMWYLWRLHDVTETGTVLDVTPHDLATGAANGFHTFPWDLKDGSPAYVDEGASIRTLTRALPDGEILVGTPIPAVVPLPGKPMAPMPAPVTLVTKDANGDLVPDSSQANVQRVDEVPDNVSCSDPSTITDPDVLATCGVQPKNPGFPFWVAGVDCGGAAGLADATGCRDGIVGQRPTTPPMDMLTVAEARDLEERAIAFAIFDTRRNEFRQPLRECDPANPPRGRNQECRLNPDFDGLFGHPGFVTAAGGFDGGLPRHALEGYFALGQNDPATARAGATGIVVQHQTPLDFRKVIKEAKPVYYPEQGTDLEQAAMRFHAQRHHNTFLPDGASATGPNGFRTNGALPVPGAPYQEPCVDDEGDLFTTGSTGQFFGNSGLNFTGAPARGANNPRIYKGANIQIDAVFNKVGYHFPQQRIISLWGDVADYEAGRKAPEPLVMRMNTFDCVQFYHSNLVPAEYELDDYQVRTPTDIIGQHIHLPKWDLTTTDGAANGWNYEDGTLSPQMVIERIHAINDFNDEMINDGNPATNPIATLPKPDGTGGGLTSLTEAAHPFFGDPGARITIQRWFTDPVVNNANEDRGLGIVFTHDHYGPSTHQQVGLYATVLTEPAGSVWLHNETGETLGTRDDGGPTSWQAAIINGNDSYREFYFEYGDFQHAYEAGVAGIMPDAVPIPTMFRNAINPSFRQEAGPVLPDIVRFPPFCPGGGDRPCPEAISADDVGMLVVNYRNEPVGLRVFDPTATGPDGNNGTQADGLAGDLAFALQSRTDRAIAALNTSQGVTTYPALNADVLPGDPFTPMIRANVGDIVRVKIQAGATEHEHNAIFHGVKWLQGGSGFGESPNSGWRNSQSDGISEQFTLKVPPVLDPRAATGNRNDLVYAVDASQDGWWSGTWGLMRVYDNARGDMAALPNSQVPMTIKNRDNFNDQCPNTAPVRSYDLTAVLANDVLGKPAGVTIPPNTPDATTGFLDNEGGPLDPAGGTLVYNPRDTVAEFQGPLHDPTAMLYVHTADLVDPDDPTLGLIAGAPVEPVVLRAAAGECIEVTLNNKLLEQAVVAQEGAFVDSHPAAGTEPVFSCQPVPLIDEVTGLPVIDPDTGLTVEECDDTTLAAVFTPEGARAALDEGLWLVKEDGTPVQNTPPFDAALIAFDQIPDLAGYNTLLQMVIRDDNDGAADGGGVTTFNNNLIRPSAYVGLHAQLVAYDFTSSDGTNVGRNPEDQTVAPGGVRTYRWYAGDVAIRKTGKNYNFVATPVEFGGSNLMPADKVKQGQKGLVGALIIEPAGSTWTEDAGQHASATVDPGTPGNFNDDFRDFAVVFQKGLNLRYGDGTPVENIAGEGGVLPEDSHDAGQKAINYGTEPAWFRFGLPANASFGTNPNELGAVTDAHRLYSNSLAGGTDPATPVFTAAPGQEVRMRVLEPTGVGRGSTFDLQGHIWQRDPYRTSGGFPSKEIGNNPYAMYLGHQESIQPGTHFEIIPKDGAGGGSAATRDYLFRDHGSFGNTDGLWGILRVGPLP